MEIVMRTSQKLRIGQACYRLLLVAVLTLVVSSMYPLIRIHAANRNRPVRIGVLTESWGPTPATAGLRDGLLELGYHEREDYMLGIRFTKGDNTDLPGAARQLVKYGADLIFATSIVVAKAPKK